MADDLDAALDYVVNYKMLDSILPEFADSHAFYIENVGELTHRHAFNSDLTVNWFQEPELDLPKAPDDCVKHSTSNTRVSLRQPRRTRKITLENLRLQVAELTKTVQELKKQTLRQTRASDDGSTAAKRNIAGVLWKGIADRQLQQRQEAEARNKTLRGLLQEQRRERKNLKRLFHRRCDDTLLEQTPYRQRGTQFLQNPHRDVKADFRNLLAETKVSGKRLESKAMTQVLCPGRKATLYPNVVRGVFFEVLDKTRVPFHLVATANAIWKAIKGPKDRDGEHMNVKICSQEIENDVTATHLRQNDKSYRNT